ncbi:hypothetical protein ABFS82_04G017900 [Erythranthe guttata]|nr:PREDICTED: nuclear transcription factor Y subunit B-4 [Erythranthe guttata]|eukprot:XP_012833303.1 PREDICTED: nuclear transcription factor Y subunit B-4 [Erythranthe guttata]
MVDKQETHLKHSKNNYAALSTSADHHRYETTYDESKEQDRLLPIANVGRIMKQILPPSAKISKEAKETMQECASEFIGFVTGEASHKCHKEKRKTVNGDDVCWALSNLGFDDYSDSLKRYLIRYRDAEGERANQNKAAGGGGGSGGGGDRDDEVDAPPLPFSFNLMDKRRN